MPTPICNTSVFITMAPRSEPKSSTRDRLDPCLAGDYDLIFRYWITLPLDAQFRGLHLFLSGAPASDVAQSLGATRAQIPESAGGVERRLFTCQMSILVATHRHRVAPRDSTCQLVESMIREAHSQGGSVQVSMKVIAHKLRVSPSHLGKRFETRTGATFRNYLRMPRMLRAAKLLIHRASLRYASITLGYSDPSHLTRDLCAGLGVSPVELRRFLPVPALSPPALRRPISSVTSPPPAPTAAPAS